MRWPSQSLRTITLLHITSDMPWPTHQLHTIKLLHFTHTLTVTMLDAHPPSFTSQIGFPWATPPVVKVCLTLVPIGFFKYSCYHRKLKPGVKPPRFSKSLLTFLHRNHRNFHWHTESFWFLYWERKKSEAKKRTKEEGIERGDYGSLTEKVF